MLDALPTRYIVIRRPPVVTGESVYAVPNVSCEVSLFSFTQKTVKGDGFIEQQ